MMSFVVTFVVISVIYKEKVVKVTVSSLVVSVSPSSAPSTNPDIVQALRLITLRHRFWYQTKPFVIKSFSPPSHTTLIHFHYAINKTACEEMRSALFSSLFLFIFGHVGRFPCYLFFRSSVNSS